jgi:hypothetical protein
VVERAFLVADLGQRIGVHLVQLGQDGTGDLPAPLDLLRQLSGEPRALGPTSPPAEIANPLDGGHQPDVGRGTAQEALPLGLVEGPETLGLVVVGRALQRDQGQKLGVVLLDRDIGGALRPGVEARLNLAALVGVKHPPETIEAARAVLLQGFAAGAFDVLVALRRVGDLADADLVIELIEARGHRRHGRARRPGSGGDRQSPDQR